MKSLVLIFLSITLINIHASEIKQELRPKQLGFLKGSPLNRDQLGFVLIDIETNKIVEAHNSEKLFLPASLSKIPTTYFALKTLGANYRYETKILTTGKVRDGVLHGDLYLFSNGDPFLTNSKLQNLILDIKLKGINKVAGKFYFDASALPKIERISSLGLGDQTYNTGLSALNAEFNRFHLWRYGKTRHTSKSNFKTIPLLESLEVNKKIRPFSPGQRFINKDNPSVKNKEVWEVSNQLRYKRREEIPVRNTSLFTAELFRYLAHFQGLKLSRPQEKKVSTSAKELAVLKSLPLSQLVSMAMEYSNNLFTEIFLLTAAKKVKGKNVNLEDSALIMKDWMTKNFPKDNWRNSFFDNGSGLSVNNKVTPLTLTKFFQKVHNEKMGDTYYWNFLSISGQSGWMRNRLNDAEMSYRVWAKTGSLDYISNLSGYLMTKKGKKLAFSFFGNDFKKRESLQAPNSKAINKIRQQAKKWRVNTMETMDKFLTDWVHHY